jgi:DNA-binding transcriptional MerR regulator/quercetin dioxygenase-like cupin family protein
MAYTVKQVARMSGVSVRTLHFYDEVGLLKPARVGSNGYRYYEQEQLLRLQQILFYRELGMELKQIEKVLGRGDFKIVGTLKGHRKVLAEKMERTRKLIATIDKTLGHLKGKKKMKGEELFVGFSVGAGEDRFGQRVVLGGKQQHEGEPIDCKVSGKDTDGAMCVFEFECTFGGPKHVHLTQDEWIYVVDGEFELLVEKKRFRLKAGESVFIPRNVGHAWRTVDQRRGRMINVYQPAGRMEEFFRELAKWSPGVDKAMDDTALSQFIDDLHKFFGQYGMDVVGPPLGWEDKRLLAAGKT